MSWAWVSPPHRIVVCSRCALVNFCGLASNQWSDSTLGRPSRSRSSASNFASSASMSMRLSSLCILSSWLLDDRQTSRFHFPLRGSRRLSRRHDLAQRRQLALLLFAGGAALADHLLEQGELLFLEQVLELGPLGRDVLEPLLVEHERVAVRLDPDLDRSGRLVGVEVVQRRVRAAARRGDAVDQAIRRGVVAALEAGEV